METRTLYSKYIEENYSTYDNGLYWIWSDVGRGKTESLKTCNQEAILCSRSNENRHTILCCGSNELGIQIHYRHPEIIKDIHLINPTSSRVKKKGWEQFEGFVNYESFFRLQERVHLPHFLAIDEPAQLWKQASSYHPEKTNYDWFRHYLENVPVVIFLGYDDPEYILEELEEVSQIRGDNFLQIRYV